MTSSSFLNNSEFLLTWQLVRNALLLNDWSFKAGLANMPVCPCCDSGLEETVLHACYYYECVRLFWSHVEKWTPRISPKQLVGYDMNNIDPLYQGEKRVVFLTILAVARMVIWVTRNKGLYDGANFSYRDLILFLDAIENAWTS